MQSHARPQKAHTSFVSQRSAPARTRAACQEAAAAKEAKKEAKKAAAYAKKAEEEATAKKAEEAAAAKKKEEAVRSCTLHFHVAFARGLDAPASAQSVAW
jgi:hypothetical protein